MSQELLTRANWWLSQGAELVPIRTGTKHSIQGYGPHLKRVTNAKDAWYWWGKLGVNLGVVCGGMAGLAVLDFDDADLYDAWRLDSAPLTTYTEKTGRGYHVFFKTENIPNALNEKVELRTSGTVMVAPSRHPEGRHYEIVQDGPIAKFTVDEVEQLFPYFCRLITMPVEVPAPEPSPLPSFEKPTVASRIKAARKASEEAARLTTLVGRNGRYYGLCPFHDDKNPSFWVNVSRGIWGCHSPRCPTNDGGQKAHDVINLRAYAEGITVREAIRQLADELLPPLPHQPKFSRLPKRALSAPVVSDQIDTREEK